MNKVILADNQAVWRAGAARILSMHEDIRIIAQLSTAEQLRDAVSKHQHVIILFSSSLAEMPDFQSAFKLGNRCIAVLENHENDRPYKSFPGVIRRDVEAEHLVRCVRLVGQGDKIHMKSFQPTIDEVGVNLTNQLNAKEKKIAGLIAQAYRNKEIAIQLGTTEQTIKNSLRSIYDKTGLSDRLELALFVLHHPVLASDCLASLGG